MLFNRNNKKLSDYKTFNLSTNEFFTKLRTNFSKLKQEVRKIMLDNKQFSVGIDQICAATEEQSQAAVHISSSINNLRDDFDAINKDVGKINVDVTSLSKKDKESIATLELLSNNSKVMINDFNSLKSNIELYQESIKSILRISKMISDILLSLNIVSLNASIEASRAGKNGKGFSVIAEEVRRLTSQTDLANKEINEIVNSSSLTINQVLKSAKNTEQSIEKSLQDIQGISLSMKEMSELIWDINSLSSDIVRFSSKMNVEVNEIDSSVQSMAASIEETSASTEQLASATSLQNLQFITILLKDIESNITNLESL